MSTAATTRSSPPTQRVIEVLDFLVAHKDRRFGLSELARELGISKPTCLGIVTVLSDGGYLSRDPSDKSYGLGPALIAAGRAAQQGFAIGPVARGQLAALTERFSAVCSVSAVVGERIAVLEVTNPPGVHAETMVGQVYPFAPPVGLMYVLWSGDRELSAWLRKEPTLPVRVDRERLRRVVEQCRSHGYLVETQTPMGRRLHTVMAGVASRNLPPEVRELLGEMVSSLGERVRLDGEDPTGEVNLIAAPAFGPDGRQACVLTLNVGAAIADAEISERGLALVAAADAVTAELGGHRPGAGIDVG